MNSMCLSRRAALAALLLGLTMGAAQAAPEPYTLKWAELQPDAPALRQTLVAMSPAQKERLMRALQQRELQRQLDTGRLSTDALPATQAALLQEDLRDLAPLLKDITAFEARRAREMNPARQDQLVSLRGYLLPMRMKDNKVTEFLLVPTAGACIHTPPPPINQMVVVSYPAGWPLGDLADPVTVAGKLSIGRTRARLALSDGTSDVEAGYTMAADLVRP